MFGQNEIVGKKFFKVHNVPLAVNKLAAELMITSMFYTLQGEGPHSGKPALFLRLAKCNLACSFCFPSNLPIAVKGKGTVRLDEVKVGDKIITLDDNLHPRFTTVKATNSRWVDSDQMVKIKYREGKVIRQLMVTKDHPFNVKGKGFVKAGELEAGMVVHHIEGSERTAFRMAENNPMKDKETAKRVGDLVRSGYKSGELVPYERSKSWRRNQSARMAKKNPMHDHDTVKKVTESKVYDKSTLEKKVHRVLRSAGFSVKYTGNRKGWMIGNSTHGYKRPDFVFEGTKKILEVYDRSYPFYTDHRHTERGEREYKESRRRHYKRFGYQVGFITAQDLGLESAYTTMSTPVEVVRDKVNSFLTNGVTIVSIGKVEDKRAFSSMSRAGTYKNNRVKVTNFTCDGNNTFCMKGLHTHNCDTFFDSGDWMTFQEIKAKMYHTLCDFWNTKGQQVPLWAMPKDYNTEIPDTRSLGHWTAPNIVLVITGGEPFLQDNLVPFMHFIADVFPQIQVESNGILTPPTLPDNVMLVCSPKCQEENGKATVYLKPSAVMLERAFCLKFVMQAHQESPYSGVPQWALEWRDRTGKDIYVSPMNVYNDMPRQAKELRAFRTEGITMEERSTKDEVVSFWEPGLLDMQANQLNHEYTAQYAITHGLKLSLQTHLMASLA